MSVIENTIESLLPHLFKVADQHVSENVSNGARLAADALLMFLDLAEDEQRAAMVA